MKVDIREALLTISIPDEYVEHGNVEILREEVGIDAYSIQRRIEEVLCGPIEERLKDK